MKWNVVDAVLTVVVCYRWVAAALIPPKVVTLSDSDMGATRQKQDSNFVSPDHRVS